MFLLICQNAALENSSQETGMNVLNSIFILLIEDNIFKYNYSERSPTSELYTYIHFLDQH